MLLDLTDLRYDSLFTLPDSIEQRDYILLKDFIIDRSNLRINLIWINGNKDSYGFGSIEELTKYKTQLDKIEYWLCQQN